MNDSALVSVRDTSQDKDEVRVRFTLESRGSVHSSHVGMIFENLTVGIATALVFRCQSCWLSRWKSVYNEIGQVIGPEQARPHDSRTLELKPFALGGGKPIALGRLKSIALGGLKPIAL